MTDAEIQAVLVDRSVLALTLWGEARGEPIEGRIAVGCVIRNRLAMPHRFRAAAATYRAICLAPHQFSCWAPTGGAENYAAVMRLAARMAQGRPLEDLRLDECLWLADGLMSGVVLDRTQGATMYWAPKAMLPPGRVPTWAEGRTTEVIGSQVFLNA